MEINHKITKFWLYKQFGGKMKWKTLQHNGMMFPPPYIHHNIPILFDGEKVQLDDFSEEYATIYAKYTDTEYVKNKVFRKNFWNDWKKIM